MSSYRWSWIAGVLISSAWCGLAAGQTLVGGRGSGGIEIDPRPARGRVPTGARRAVADGSAPLRWVSLARWLQAEQAGQPAAGANAAADALARGLPLAEIHYVLVLPGRRDLVLGGPAAVEAEAVDGQPVLLAQQRAHWLLDALRAAHAFPRQPLGCSIEPSVQRVRHVLRAPKLEMMDLQAQLRQLAQQLGPQQVRVFGVAPRCPLAGLLVDTDVQLKQLAMGTRLSGVPAVPDLLAWLDDRQPSGLPRVWLHAEFFPIGSACEGQAFALKMPRAVARAAADGRFASAAHSDRGAQRWAATINTHYRQLAERHPLLARLEEAMNYCQVAALLQQETLWQAADLPSLESDDDDDGEPLPTLETIVRLKRSTRKTLVVMGGIEIDPWRVPVQAAEDHALRQLWHTCRLPEDLRQWQWQHAVP